MAVVIGCGMLATIWNAAPAIVSRMGASADVAKCVINVRVHSGFTFHAAQSAGALLRASFESWFEDLLPRSHVSFSLGCCNSF